MIKAHFCEHLLGSTRLPIIRGRVLEGNAQTRRDFTRYYLLVPHEALEYALAAQADRLDYPLDAHSENWWAQRLPEALEFLFPYVKLTHRVGHP
jgi:predicted Zn-dependent peptidase